MRGLLLLLICFTHGVFAQSPSKDAVRDRAIDNIGNVLLDTRSKTIHDQLRRFEDAIGLKVQFRVEDASIDQLGGLSEHLFRLFQQITTEPSNARTITGEFSALENGHLSGSVHYSTYATSDLRTCRLPEKDTRKIDSVYCNALSGGAMGSTENAELFPEGLDGVYPQALNDYQNVLAKHNSCPGIFDANDYNVHVVNTRQSRKNNWHEDVNSISMALTTDFSLLTSGSSAGGTPNNGITEIDLKVDDNLVGGRYILNLNNSLNPCTEKDMEVRCRLLWKKTKISLLFLTQDVPYYLPLDSMQVFRDEAVATLMRNGAGENLIVALWIRMRDPVAGSSLGNLLVAQNGNWLTKADIELARFNNAGTYTAGTFYKFNSLYRNIPKPLIICYQLAKVNGVLSTTYFEKKQHVKGREQVYAHVFRIDKALEEIRVLRDRLNTQKHILTQSNSDAFSDPKALEEMERLSNCIRQVYAQALIHPQFKEAPVHYKEKYLQHKLVVQLAALRYVSDNFGGAYDSPLARSQLSDSDDPDDILEGSCDLGGSSDVIGDALSIASLLLSPTGLDFIPDALSVCWYVSNDDVVNAMMSSASLLAPGNIRAFRKVLSSSADVINALQHGEKLLLEQKTVSSIEHDSGLLLSLYGLDPQKVDQSLLAKVRSNNAAARELMDIPTEQSRLFGYVTVELPEAERIEFTEKALEDAQFRKRVLENPDEVLKWAGVVEKVRDITKTEFLSSVNEFTQFPSLGEVSWELFKQSKWNELQELFIQHNFKSPWPPIKGFITKKKKKFLVGDLVERLGGYFEDGVFKDKGQFVAPIGAKFEGLSLPEERRNDIKKYYRFIKEFEEAAEGPSIPWFGMEGHGTQFYLEKNIDYLLEHNFIEEVHL